MHKRVYFDYSLINLLLLLVVEEKRARLPLSVLVRNSYEYFHGWDTDCDIDCSDGPPMRIIVPTL